MAPKFGTSGLRGLVTELTPDLVADYTRAYLAACDTGPRVLLGRDLRESSPEIAAVVRETLLAEGLDVTDCGTLPTPALALASEAAEAGAVMVTGSHIPADRNGLKFYTPRGEIGKADEAAILAALGTAPATGPRGALGGTDAAGAYATRYVTAFGPRALAGLRLGVYQHSSVARDILADVARALGADVVLLGRSEVFIPVDTEAVDATTRAMLAGWAADHGLDAILSTDGDADRPMLTDATGRMIPGDVLGVLTARSLGADTICTPVSANTMVDRTGGWQVHRTQIGSPFVIAAMEAANPRSSSEAVAHNKRSSSEAVAHHKTIGYEPNGGFLLGFEAMGPAGPLPPLMTRDCLLPMLAPLAEAARTGTGLADLVAALPARFTVTDRAQGIDSAASQALIDRLEQDASARAAVFAAPGPETGIDTTDGLRVSYASGAILHLRPSGNAPELRCYAETDDPVSAATLVADTLKNALNAVG